MSFRQLSEIERRFCSENGIDVTMASGGSLDSNAGAWRRDGISIEGGRGFDDSPVLGQIDAIVIEGRARFANAIIKLANALAFAKAHGIKNVFHEPYEALSDDICIDGVSVRSGAPGSDMNSLKYGFFYGATLRPMEGGRGGVRRDLVRLLEPGLKFRLGVPAASVLHEDVLTIHIRSGDIFREAIPHPLYGQPPLSFYSMVLDRKRWSSVRLVCEDARNPVVGALIELLGSSGTRYERFSKGLLGDLELLAEASDLIIGRGTFIYPVLCLSRCIRNVYCFEEDQRRYWGLGSGEPNFVVVSDRDGQYRESILKSWRNTPEQRAMMLKYPRSNIDYIKSG